MRKSYRSDSVTRRSWLTGVSLIGLGGLSAGDDPPKHAVPDDVAEAAFRQAKRVGLKDFRTSESEHYMGIGDATDDFRKSAVDLCEKLASSYQSHFRANGFEVNLPKTRMAVVILANKVSYARFNEEPASQAGAGHYFADLDLLVTYNVGPGRSSLPARITNTFTLVHEAVHQLTYATRLLERKGDVPVALSEGLATYCETWKLSHPVIAEVNLPRLGVLADKRVRWLPLARLLVEDGLFDDPATCQAAYSESWLLIHSLMESTTTRQKLRSYLDAIRPRQDPSKRIQDATNALGGLERLDETLRTNATALIEKATLP